MLLILQQTSQKNTFFQSLALRLGFLLAFRASQINEVEFGCTAVVATQHTRQVNQVEHGCAAVVATQHTRQVNQVELGCAAVVATQHTSQHCVQSSSQHYNC